MDGGDGDVDAAGRVVDVGDGGARSREVILVLTEDVGTEYREVDVVHGDLADLRQVDGHLARLQVEEAGLVDDCRQGEGGALRKVRKATCCEYWITFYLAEWTVFYLRRGWWAGTQPAPRS